MNLNFLKTKSILVVGGTGYIGSSLVKAIGPYAKSVTVWNRSTNLCDPTVWKRQLPKTDLIFYLAAQTSSKYANENPLEDVTINLLPIITFINVCTEGHFRPDIIFASTVTAVGITKSYPVNESLPNRPITVYDIHKLAAEKYVFYYATVLKGNAGVLRLANVYGPSGSESKATDRGIVSFFVKQVLQNNPITIYGDGMFMRDYIFIDDIINAFLLSANYIRKLHGNYYVIGSGFGHTIVQMAKTIVDSVFEKTGKKGTIKSVPPPIDLSPIESRHFIADSSAYKKITEWNATITLEEGIKKTVDYFIKKT